MNTNTSHPLIPNSQEYIIYKKYFSVHSEDIDTSKYTDNCFEIEIPQDYLNVLSVKLTDITLPPNIYNFSQALGNTTLFFDISLDPVSPSAPVNLENISLSATIPDGFYSSILGTNLPTLVVSSMNNAVNAFLGVDNYPNFNTTNTGLENIQIGPYPTASFTLFNKYVNPYIPNTCTNTLGCNGGQLNSTSGTLYYDLGFIDYSTESTYDLANLFYSVTSVNQLNYNTYSYIYMEIEGLNHIDELVPYTKNNYTLRNNGNSGIVNSAFAKIPITSSDTLNSFPYAKQFFYNYKYFNPPAERMRKLKIKFRYHNNVLVNFNGGSYTFLMEFALYDNQILRNYKLSRPVVQI